MAITGQRKYCTDKATIKLHGGDDPVDNLAGVLYIEPASGPEVEVSGGGYADTKTRKEIEAAAIAFATCDLVRRGFQVHDVQSENRGYDLLAVLPSDELLVEVKGADSLEPRFFLTRNERRFSSKQHKWRLFVVCNARTAPVLHQYTADEMLHQFTLDPLAWECTRNGSKIT